MTPFEEATSLINDKWFDVKNHYMVNRILSCSPNTFLSSIKINQYIFKLGKPELTALMNLCVKKSNYKPYFHYPKKLKLKERLLIKKICSVFCVNSQHAAQIVKIYRKMKLKPEEFFGLKKDE